MNTQNITKLMQSPKASAIVRILLALFILVIVFWAGVSVGWRKAEFSYRFSDNYYRSFGGHGRGPMGIADPDDLIGGHGAVGKVISVNLPTIIVSDANGIEKAVRITGDTVVRSARMSIASTTITDRDFIVVIGAPGSNGQVVAKLIRILPPPPSFIASTSAITQ